MFLLTGGKKSTLPPDGKSTSLTCTVCRPFVNNFATWCAVIIFFSDVNFVPWFNKGWETLFQKMPCREILCVHAGKLKEKNQNGMVWNYMKCKRVK